MDNTRNLFLFGLVLALLSGCAIVHPILIEKPFVFSDGETKQIIIRSHPRFAKVYVKNTYIGDAPLKIYTDNAKELIKHMKMEKDGYYAIYGNRKKTFSQPSGIEISWGIIHGWFWNKIPQRVSKLSSTIDLKDEKEKLKVVSPEAKQIATNIQIPKSEKEKLTSKKWELIGNFAKIRTVYIAPTSAIKDKDFVSQILNKLVNIDSRRKKILQIMFFDNKKYTPTSFPMSDIQMLHWKAQYIFNPTTNYESFHYIKVTNPHSSPPEVKPIASNIRVPKENKAENQKREKEELKSTFDNLKTGTVLRYDIDLNEIYIYETYWYSMNLNEKQNFARSFARLCDLYGSTGRCAIYGAMSGKKLASYSGVWGFKTY